MVDLRIDIRTKEMLNITPCKECCKAEIRNIYSSFIIYQNKLIASIYLSLMNHCLLNLCALPTMSKHLFGQCMTSPYRRACCQANFSEGGFARKVPFSFFLTFFLFSLLPFLMFFWPIALLSFY